MPDFPTQDSKAILREVAYHREILDPPTGWHVLAKKLGYSSPEVLRKFYSRHKDEVENLDSVRDEYDQFAKIEFQDSRNAIEDSVAWRDIFTHAENGANLTQRLETTQEISTVSIDCKGPIAICYTADWHLGDLAVDYSRWKDDIQLILDTPNMYMITLGDLYQNMRTFKMLSSVLSQVISPKQQVHLLRGIADELATKQKLICAVEGNHDAEFDERIFGQSLQEYVWESSLAPRFKNKGVLSLRVGEQTYENLLFHKSRFRSILRPAHGAYREWEFVYPAEVVAGAHDHAPAVEVFWGYQLARDMGKDFGGETYLVKLGSYQQGDYGVKYFQRGYPMMPTIIYYPDRHEKRIVFHPSHAVDLLRKENP